MFNCFAQFKSLQMAVVQSFKDRTEFDISGIARTSKSSKEVVAHPRQRHWKKCVSRHYSPVKQQANFFKKAID